MLLPAFLFPLLLLAEVAWAVERTVDNTCPPKLLTMAYRRELQVQGDYCYHFVLNKFKVYSDANRACIKNGGTLALPKTEEINDFLVDKLGGYVERNPVWIGLHDKKKEGKFVWEDGKKLGDWDSFAKDNGPGRKGPKRFAEDCVALHPTDSHWHDYQCKKGFFALVGFKNPRKHYICQYTRDLPAEKARVHIKLGTGDMAGVPEFY